MATFLFFSSLDSLFSYLNIIIVAVIIFWSINRFWSYLTNVIIYAISKTFIPKITLSILYFLGVKVKFDILTINILLIIYFILGLIVIKITEKIVEHFDTDTIIYFIIIFAIIDLLVSWIFSTILNLFI